MTLNEKMLAAIYEAEYEEIKHSAIYKIDFQKAANECEAIAEDFANEFNIWAYKNHWEFKGSYWYSTISRKTIKNKELTALYKQSLIK